MMESADRDVKALSEELGDLRSDISKISDMLAGIVQRRTADAFDVPHEAAGKIANGARSAAASAINEVEERPILAIVSALAVGITLGFLVNRRS